MKCFVLISSYIAAVNIISHFILVVSCIILSEIKFTLNYIKRILYYDIDYYIIKTLCTEKKIII